MPVRRTIDVSRIIEGHPCPDQVMPPMPPAPHKETLGPERRREDAMFILRIQPTQLGDPAQDVLELITFSVDPPGTHLETYYPHRFFYSGVNDWTVRDVAHFPVKQLVNEAIVIEARDLERAVGPADLEQRAKHLRPGDSVLFRTGTNIRWRDPGLHRETMGTIYAGQKTGVTVEGAKWLSEREIGIFAMDCRSPEDPNANWNLKTHEELLTHNVMLCEDIANLDRLTQDRVVLVGGTPLKGRHLTGTAARMVALETLPDGGYRPVDLTHVIGSYPDEAPSQSVRVELVEDRENVIQRMDILFFDISEHGIGDSTGPQYIRFSTQAGTHLLNPRRYTNGRSTPLFTDLTEIPIDRLVRAGCVVDLSHLGPKHTIRASDIRNHGSHIQPGDWVFLRTDYVDWYRDSPDYFRLSPTLSPEAVDELARRGSTGVVADVAQLAPIEGRWDLYAALHERNLLAVEGAWHLWLIRQARFLAAVLPLKVKGLTSSPAHVFAIEEWR